MQARMYSSAHRARQDDVVNVPDLGSLQGETVGHTSQASSRSCTGCRGTWPLQAAQVAHLKRVVEGRLILGLARLLVGVPPAA